MPPRVLVVDDEPDVLNTLLRFLAFGSYESVGLTQFEEAKAHIDSAAPDILITDVRLGAYNGLHLALHMRNVRPDAVVVVLSAWDDPALRHEATTMGAHYHTKP